MGKVIPKNVCCVGQIGRNKKVFVEEYVISFLQETIRNETKPQMIVFYGDGYEEDGCKYFYLKGVAAHRASGDSFGKMDEFFFRTVGKKYFSEWKGIGWYRTKGNKECEDILQVLQNICEQNFKDIKGYYIYFEKNSAMEEYISHCSIKNDTNVIGEARKRDNKNIASGNKKSINIIKGKLSPVMAMQVLNMVSLGILIICCIIAVTTLNQYDKMKQLEETVNYLEISMEEQKNLPED